MQGYNYTINSRELPAYLNFSSQPKQPKQPNQTTVPGYLVGISGVTVYSTVPTVPTAQIEKVSEAASSHIGVNPQDLPEDKIETLENKLKESIAAFRNGEKLEEDNADLALGTGLPENLPSPDQLTSEQKSHIEKMIFSEFNKTPR